MKRSFYVLIIALMCSSSVISQRNKIAIGPAFSTLFITDGSTVFSQDYSLNLGPYIGGYTEFLATDFASFWAGINVGSRGFRYKFEFEVGGVENVSKGKLSLYYVDIPALARVDFAIGSVTPYAIFGPYGGFAFYGREVSKFGPVGDLETFNSGAISWGDEGFYKRFDYGLNGGAGVVFGQFDIELSYLFGLANLSSNDSGSIRVNNRSIRFSLGYYFNQSDD